MLPRGQGNRIGTQQDAKMLVSGGKAQFSGDPLPIGNVPLHHSQPDLEASIMKRFRIAIILVLALAATGSTMIWAEESASSSESDAGRFGDYT